MIITENKYKLSYNIPIKAYNYYKENNISFSEIANIGLNILRTKASYKEIEEMKRYLHKNIKGERTITTIKLTRSNYEFVLQHSYRQDLLHFAFITGNKIYNQNHKKENKKIEKELYKKWYI